MSTNAKVDGVAEKSIKDNGGWFNIIPLIAGIGVFVIIFIICYMYIDGNIIMRVVLGISFGAICAFITMVSVDLCRPERKL